MVAWPSSGRIIWTRAAMMITTIFSGPLRLLWCIENSRITVATTK